MYRVLERHIGSSLEDRTAILSQINDLGPPDLVNLTKTVGVPTSSNASSLPSIGTYLYYTGADTSNVATIAALLNSLATIIGQEPQLWFGKPKPFHVSHATYSTYNAFRKLDLRVSVAFPGSVSWEVLDAWGNHASSEIVPPEEVDVMWEECFVSAIVRSLITSDDDGDFSSIVEIRRINPFLDPKVSVSTFLTGFEHLYPDGEKLGCNEDIQVPTRLNNYLVDSFIKCVELTGCFDEAMTVLQRLYEKYPEVAAVIAKVLFISNHELEAVKFIHDKLSHPTSVAEIPGASQLLLLQSEYCLEKSRADLALPLAVRAVESSPSMFAPWAHLVKIYISLNKFEDALLTLNACPMVTHKDKYILKRIASGAADKMNGAKGDASSASSASTSQPTSSAPLASDMHLPLPQDVFLRGVTDLNSLDVAAEHSKLTKPGGPNNRRSSEVNSIVTPQSLLTLPAGSLKSTFRRAYSLLADIVHRLGWEGMLNIRSKVFVMEEEWRRDPKVASSAESSNPGESKTSADLPTNGSGETTDEFRKKRLCERWLDNLFMLLYEDMKAYTYCRAQEMQAESMADEPINSNAGSNPNTLTPNATSTKSSFSETLGLWGGARSRSNSSNTHPFNDPNSIAGKAKVDPYTESRSCLEWELLGLVSERLGHVRDAQRCYERALARRFSVRAAKKLVGIYGRWRDRARKQIGIQGKLQYAALTNNNNVSNKTTDALLGQSKWNASTMSVANNTNNENNNSNVANVNNNSSSLVPDSLSTHHANSSSLSISKVNTSTIINNHVVHIRDPMRYDVALLRLTVGLLVWDYRWYTLFSPLLLNTLSSVVNDMGVTKVESEVRVWFDDIRGNRGIFDIVNLSINVLESWGRIEVET